MSIIERMREVAGDLTQAELAELLGEKQHRVNAILGGKQRVPEDFLVKFLEAFKVDANWLVLGITQQSELTAREAALLDNYRNSPEEEQRSLETMGALLAKRGKQNGKKGEKAG